MDEYIDNTPPPEDLQKLLDEATPELLAYKPPKRVKRSVTRKRVVVLTDIIVESWAPLADFLDEELSPARAEQRKAELARIDNRAWIYYAADIAAGERHSNIGAAEAAKLAITVNEHDHYLLGWATPMFGKDPRHAATLRDISRGHGRWDDADDVQRLVTLFRSNWDQVKENPWVTEEYLDTAAADAAKQLDYLRSRKNNKARRLANAAFAMWYFDYNELMKLGRYLARDDDDWRERFPGVRELATGSGAAADDEDLEDEGLEDEDVADEDDDVPDEEDDENEGDQGDANA
jgi:hypothetical protein